MSYRDDVQSIAEDIVREHGLKDDSWHDAISESVDGSSWIIYYSHNEEVLDNTDNEPDNKEVACMVKENGNWRDFRQVAAYMAMERDVWEACRKIVENEEFFTCEHCDETKEEDEQSDLEGYCKACVIPCEGCKELIPKSGMDNYGTEEHPLCKDCDKEDEG